MENREDLKKKRDYRLALQRIKEHKKSECPKVSVIVPVYKVDRYLTPCLDSIVNQTLEDIEIIIVDEGDHDRCREIIDYFEKIDPRVIAPHKKNGGYGASCNLGLDMAKGEYIAIVESDDMIEPEMYEEMYEYAKRLDADVVKTPFCYWNGEDEKKECEYRYEAAQQCPQGKLFSVKEFDLPLRIHASLWAGIYRTSYMREKNIRFIEAKGGAYVDVGFRIDTLVNTDKMAWLDKPYYLYRTNNDESTTNNFNLTAMLKRWKEAHEKFDSLGDDYEKYYEKSLLKDEYLNTLSYINHDDTDFNDEQIEMLINNFSYLHKENIENNRFLNKYEKKEIISFIESPRKYYRRVKQKVRASMAITTIKCRYETIRRESILLRLEIADLFFIALLLCNKYELIMQYIGGLNAFCLMMVFIITFLVIAVYLLWGVKHFINLLTGIATRLGTRT